MIFCEVRRLDDPSAWDSMSIDDMLARGRGEMRCPECRGRVRAHKSGTTGQGAHFEHREGHKGCSLGSSFDGTKRPHPNPLL
jgi:hypothetical protein